MDIQGKLQSALSKKEERFYAEPENLSAAYAYEDSNRENSLARLLCCFTLFSQKSENQRNKNPSTGSMKVSYQMLSEKLSKLIRGTDIVGCDKDGTVIRQERIISTSVLNRFL